MKMKKQKLYKKPRLTVKHVKLSNFFLRNSIGSGSEEMLLATLIR